VQFYFKNSSLRRCHFLLLQMSLKKRGSAIALHLLASVAVASLVALLVFFVWYPYPYQKISGGRDLFILLMSVDIVVGPLLTAVLFNPSKPRSELWRDLGLVVLIQLGALGYGLHTVWQARPLFLVMEIDRFKVISSPDLQDNSAQTQLAALPQKLRPSFLSGPVTVAIREPKDSQERNTVMMESVIGGRDYAERPEFYLSYEGAAALKSLQRAKPLSIFLSKYPTQRPAAQTLTVRKDEDVTQWLYVPVLGRKDWVAVLDSQGQIRGLLEGDGF